jgi:hypothetical protein
MAVFEPLCQNEKVGCHVPMFVLEHDVHVEKTDVSFACSYLWTPRRAILAPFVNQPRFILRRPSSTFYHLSTKTTCPIMWQQDIPISTEGSVQSVPS